MLTTLPLASVSPVDSWQQCLKNIQQKIGPSSFETWFRTINLVLSDPTTEACIQVPNQFFADFIEQHFAAIILESMQECGMPVERLLFVPTQKDWVVLDTLTTELTEAKVRAVPKTAEKRGQFHQNYRFENYIIGDSNRLAHAAALAVAEAPGRTSFNPLVIYGGTGLGKTHLLQAIANYAQTENTAEHVLYMTSEEFINQFMTYIREKKDAVSFYKKFHHIDLLLIDDIHFFSGKQRTQEEFFRIFNRLMLENKQIVLTSDRPPDKIPDMMTRIINRFLGGLTADIQPPTLETRMAILRTKAESDGLSLPDAVVQYLATHITSNVRELEGTLIKLIAHSSFTGRDISLAVAREICGDILQRKDERLSVKSIQQLVAQHYNISPNQLSAHTRSRDVTLQRNIAMYLSKKWTKQSMRTIGLDFGGRDYSTVLYASKKIEAELKVNPQLHDAITILESTLSSLA